MLRAVTALAIAPEGSPRRSGADEAFTERKAWAGVGEGWRQLHGDYRELGFSFEWHDFTARRAVDWGRSFHPGSVEICLNLAGHGSVSDGARELSFAPLTAGFYCQQQDQKRAQLAATRAPAERHQFLTVELSPPFLHKHLAGNEANLDRKSTRLNSSHGGISRMPSSA